MIIQKKHLITLAVLAAAILLTIVADLLIVTDSEKIDATMDSIKSSLEEGDAATLMASFSEYFYGPNGMNREQLSSVAEYSLQAYGPIEFMRYRYKKNRIGDAATVLLNVIASSTRERQNNLSTWELELKKDSDGVWRVTNLTPTRMNGRDVNGWEDIL